MHIQFLNIDEIKTMQKNLFYIVKPQWNNDINNRKYKFLIINFGITYKIRCYNIYIYLGLIKSMEWLINLLIY